MTKFQRHAMMPEAAHDDHARMGFTSALIKHLDAGVRPMLRPVYEQAVAPRLRASLGRDPTRHDIARAMTSVDGNRYWSTLRTDAQEMMYRSAEPMVDRQLPALITRAKKLSGRGLGSLQLDPILQVPRYLRAVDTHRLPGGYHSEVADDDVRAGAVFEESITMYSMGNLGTNNDDPGQSIARWLKSRYPTLRPRRILDMGCTIGHYTLPYVQVFPEAEVYAIDVAAPCLRFAHARANALGFAVHFSQQDAEATTFADGSFDLVTSRILLHEMSRRSVPGMLRECHRLLRAGGLMLHVDAPLFDELDAYQASLRHWDAIANNEPFMATVYDLPLERLYADAGFPRSKMFRAWIESDLRRRTNYDPRASRSGGRFFAVGAFKAD
ncbi:MAG: class I SAM-dependent methyltransferase [Alphaproteobacteria bacterium]|nr:class I SAM-dependent methyltransferase [Alphaproteobacteria bacterium]